jgi:hypothetical protein
MYRAAVDAGELGWAFAALAIEQDQRVALFESQHPSRVMSRA